MTIPNQTRVKNHEGRTGTTCPDIMGCCTEEEVPVVYDNNTFFEGTDESKLEILGPENAVPEPHDCGIGQGADCCIFLTAGSKGFCCERFSSLRYNLLYKEGMVSKRNPSEPYPNCMLKSSTPQLA